MSLSSSHFRTALLALSGFLLFSVTDVWAKLLTADLNAFEISFWSASTGLLFLVFCSQWLGGLKNTLRTEKLRWHLVRALLTAFIQVLNFVALKGMPLVNFYTIVFIAPFVTVVLAAIFFHEKVSWKSWALIAGGFCGVLIAMRPSIEGIGIPEMAILLSAIFFSVRNMTVAKMGAQETILSYGFYTYAGIAVYSFAMLAVYGEVRPAPPDTWLMLLGLGALGAIGVILVSFSFRTGPTSVAAPMHYSQIVWGILFGGFIFHDIPDKWDLIGAAIVCICGIFLIGRRADRTGITPPDS